MNAPIAVILAAGKGTRMKSDLPKVLCEVNGRPLIDYVLDAVEKTPIARSIVVIGYRGDDVKRTLSRRPNVDFAEQTEQLGTGHAVMMCREQLAGHDGAVVVLAGDSPMIQSDSLNQLLEVFEQSKPACMLGTLNKEDPSGLGRIVRDSEGNFSGIVEEKDATEAERQIDEVNMSTYIFDGPSLLQSLDLLDNSNKQGEYYLTDCPGILLGQQKTVTALPVLKACEALSINTVDELAIVEAEMRRMKL